MKHHSVISLVSASRVLVVLASSFAGILPFGLAQDQPIAGTRNPESAPRIQMLDLFDTAASVPGARFVHVATADNTSSNVTYIDHPLTNNNPNAIVLVTQNWNPGGVGNTYNDNPIGVWYSSGAQKWSIFNQDNTSSMPAGAAFNVLIPTTGADTFVHTATAGNIVGNSTVIDHPLTNNNPDAVVLITQNWNPGGSAGTYNDHAVGVWYWVGENKWAIFNQDAASMPAGADFNVLVAPTDPSVFVHVATEANTEFNTTYIDHPLTNNNPNAIVLVSQNWNPGGGPSGTYNDHAIGVWYSSGARKWAIFNQDYTSSMPTGAAFNVLIPTTGADAFVHITTAGNIVGHYTYIDHPLTNDNPNAIMLVTQNWNPGGVPFGIYNDHAIGVWYSSGAHKWAIFNQDRTSMPVGAAFNVLIPAVDTSVFVHIARAASITDNYTLINHPLTNNNPDAIVLVTQNWNPSGVGNTYNNYPVGVWYSGSAQKWSVFNQDDTSSMPVDGAFNVLVPSPGSGASVHTATAADTAFNYTLIDHPLSNRNPDAIVLATQNWNPGGGAGTYNDHPIGVWYSSGAQKWSVFNQDDTSTMPLGADFNIVVIVDSMFADGFESGDTSGWVVTGEGHISCTGGAASSGWYGLEVATGSSCTDMHDTVLSNHVISGLLFAESCHSVIAGNDFVVAAGGDATFLAGEAIELQNGFSVEAGAAFAGVLDTSLSAVVFVQDDTPSSESRYNARFYINVDGLTVGGSDEVEHFVAYDSHAEPQLKILIQSGSLISLGVRDDTGAFHETTAQSLVAGWNEVLVRWEAAVDATPSLQINAGTPEKLTAFDNEDSRLEFVRWGVVGGELSGTSGVIYQDDFTSWR